MHTSTLLQVSAVPHEHRRMEHRRMEHRRTEAVGSLRLHRKLLVDR